MSGQACQAHLKPQETFSKDLAAMEEACAKVISTRLGCGTTVSSIQQSENIVLNYMYNPFLATASKKEKAKYPPPPVFACMYL